MFRRERKGRRGGFTMAEVLTVVAIIGILAAVAIPSVITYQRALRLTELDDNARTIYLAAQNNLAALRSASGGTLETDGKAADVTAAGVTIPGSGTDWKYVSTNELSSTDPDWLVLPGSVDGALMEADSYYLVEFDPASGVVYGVFYSETKSGTRGAPLSASNYKTLCDNACRTRSGRNAFATDSSGFWVGYYGADGELDLTRPDAQKLPTPKLKLINAEELALEFHAKAEGTVDTNKIYYSVSVSGLNASGGMGTKTLVSQGNFIDDKTNTVVLDTLKSYMMTPGASVYDPWTVGASFSNWVEEPGGSWAIEPGADITVTVTTWYQPGSGEGLTALPQSASVKTNSLFAARSGEAGETAHIAYGRHLQNLDPGTSNVDSAITAAKQIREIDFNATGDATRYYWKSCYPSQKFTPIANPNLTHYDGQGFLIRNLDATAQSGKNAGLFETLDAATVESVTLVDAKVSAQNRSAGALAGVAQNNTQVKDCQVYITATGSTYSTATRISGANAGGLIGMTQGWPLCKVENSFASTVVHGTQNTGGLVGQANGLSVESSYAAGRLSGPKLGGLVGGGSSVTMTNCYAAGLLIPDANGEAAGLCDVEVANATRCYAAADYTTQTGMSYSIKGAVPGGNCNDVYYLAKSGVNDAATVNGVEQVNSSDQLTKEAGGKLASFTAFKTSAAKTYPYNHVTRTEEEGPLKPPYPYPALGSLPHYGDWLEATAPNVQSLVAYYEQFLSNSGYVTEYSAYVNGVEKGAIVSSTRTEAINADGYAFLSVEKLDEDWERKTNLTVKTVGMETLESTVGARYLGALDEELLPTSEDEAAYYAYAIPTTALDVVPGSTCYNEVTVKGTGPQIQWDIPRKEVETTAWVTTFFGRAAYNNAKPTSVPQPIHIRSLRHLANVGRFFGTRDYVQDLDVDASIYYGDLIVDGRGSDLAWASRAMNADGHVTVAGFEVWGRSWSGTWGYADNQWTMPAEYRLLFTPIGTHGTPGDENGGYSAEGSFNGTYDGNGRTIRALSIRSYEDKSDSKHAKYAGLFYRVTSGTLKNIHLSDCDVIGDVNSSTDANASGVLLGRLNSTGQVLDCAVKDCTVAIQATKSGGHVGGLIGRMDGGVLTVRGCTVENTTVTGDSCTYNAGGLIGYLYDLKSGGMIQDCTVKNVQVTNQLSKTNAASVEKYGTIGGFVGCMKNNAGTVENCFVIGARDQVISGASPYSGGFVGLMSNKDTGAVKNCGVRLEGTAQRDYAAQAVRGGLVSGGFVGSLQAGSIQSSYAAVKVEGATAGGFVGTFSSGSISNCYAAGHTQNGKYKANRLSVIGTTRAGGLVGLWEGGSLNTCYTTCAVSGPNDGATDIFVNQGTATTSSPIPGCYALGEAFVNDSKRGNLTKTNVATSMTELDAAQRTETHPYDATLTMKYPFPPVKYADGTSVPHYGDWPQEVSSSGGSRDWVQQVTNYDQIAKPYPRQEVDVTWVGDTLSISIDVTNQPGQSSDIMNTGPENWGFNGVFSITSDLGHREIFQVVRVGGDPYEYVLEGLPGATITWETWLDADTGANGGHWVINVPSSLIPPYVESISFDCMDAVDGEGDKYIVGNIHNGDPNYKGSNQVSHIDMEADIDIDGDFRDWLGYEHQLMERMASESGTPLNGHKEGSALGLYNKVYFHMVDTRVEELQKGERPPLISATIFGVKEIVLTGPNGLNVNIPGWYLVKDTPLFPEKKPGVVKYPLYTQFSPKWEWIGDCMSIAFYAADDREEYELGIDLDRIAEEIGYEDGSIFTRAALRFNNENMKDLVVERDPPET